ncbi:histone deacetylase family protein [Ideonella alba]|uniref:Histone deacetylase family protein n=1 Tax=Ideonella alba TaxID=2824118 RepID=A0A940YAZ4_9BURK|nr:histone deacetylase family protein [Ideonella alba]MBQ0929696.1 histone deacetylase family protein [Ideonella alba]
MLCVHSPLHRGHAGTHEIYRGELVPCFEKPERADFVLQAFQRAGLGEVRAPDDHGLAPIERIHAPRYLAFLARVWDAWAAQGGTRDLLPAVWPTRGFRDDIEPDNLVAQLGLYSFDSGSPITAGTWTAALAGAHCALTAQAAVAQGARAAFSLARPPGHHAGTDFYGGYCFLNHAAIAAQAFVDGGAARVALLDVDYHHGNGTQQIFYDRSDVLFQSIHGDPRTEYPFYLGHADETGAGAGLGFNANYPLPAGSDNTRWFEALEAACRRITAHGAEALVVSLGVDTFEGDPISRFHLRGPEFTRLGTRLAALGLPTVFVLEGGYAVAEIGDNVVSVLQGFEGG